MSAKGLRGWTALWMTVLVALGLLTGAFVIGANDSSVDPRPFDPLSQREQQEAIDLVLAHAEASGLLAGDHEVIGAALSTDKKRIEADPDGRFADVWVYDYSKDETLWALVDLGGQQTVSVDSLKDFQPAITTSEKKRASDLAFEHEDVKDQIAEWDPEDEVETLVRLWTGHGDSACPVHRCALAAFLVDGEYEPGFFVRVNLSLDRVDLVLDRTAEDDRGLLEGDL